MGGKTCVSWKAYFVDVLVLEQGEFLNCTTLKMENTGMNKYWIITFWNMILGLWLISVSYFELSLSW